jgi:hypothetical protein
VQHKAFIYLLVLMVMATVPIWFFHGDYGRYRARQHANCAPRPRGDHVGGEEAGPRLRSGGATELGAWDTTVAGGGDGSDDGSVDSVQDRDGEATTPSGAADDERFTVLLNTFKRRDLLKLAVAHYATCPDVAQIRVVWSEQTAPPSPHDPNGGGDYFGPKPSMVVYDTHPTTSIQNRFEPPPLTSHTPLSTTAVFNVDDDVRMPCPALRRGFRAWRANRDVLVG